MADFDLKSSNVQIHKAAPPQRERVEDLSPQQSSDSVSERDSSLSLGLGVDSRYDGGQEDQIEKLKEFLSDAAFRGDDVVTQRDADTVKALESMQNLQLGTKSDTGLGARLESAARANLEIQNQASSGYYPSETVYLEEHTLKEVLEESFAALLLEMPSTVSSPYSPRAEPSSLGLEPSPTRNIDAESELKNELDCLFQERALRSRDSP